MNQVFKSLITVKRFFAMSACFLVFSSCSELIEYSPYDSNINAYNLNLSAFSNISATSADTFSFAFISDPHDNYDELKNALEHINKHSGLQFVVCCGDVTNCGLSQEYEWYRKVIEKSKYPVVTVIGNHDYRSNGASIFTKMFGPTNTSFVSGAYKFVVFDDVIWENNNVSPKYDWLITELADSTHYNVLLTHIPPWSDQMEGLNSLVYKQIVTKANTILCLHGHEHSFSDTNYNEVRSIVSDNIKNRNYIIVNIVGNQSIIKQYNL